MLILNTHTPSRENNFNIKSFNINPNNNGEQGSSNLNKLDNFDRWQG